MLENWVEERRGWMKGLAKVFSATTATLKGKWRVIECKKGIMDWLLEKGLKKEMDVGQPIRMVHDGSE